MVSQSSSVLSVISLSGFPAITRNIWLQLIIKGLLVMFVKRSFLIASFLRGTKDMPMKTIPNSVATDKDYQLFKIVNFAKPRIQQCFVRWIGTFYRVTHSIKRHFQMLQSSFFKNYFRLEYEIYIWQMLHWWRYKLTLIINHWFLFYLFQADKS